MSQFQDASDDAMRDFYANNTGLSASHKQPRPEQRVTPVFRANGLAGLFQCTESLPYFNGQPENPRQPLGGAKTNQYSVNIMKEKCGCSGPILL